MATDGNCRGSGCGCGDPVAMALWHSCEVVLDLASCAGFDGLPATADWDLWTRRTFPCSP